jgi:hypothetical protein
LTSFLATNYSLPMALFPLSTPIVFAPCAAAKRVVPRRFTRNAQESARSPQIPEPGDTLFPNSATKRSPGSTEASGRLTVGTALSRLAIFPCFTSSPCLCRTLRPIA